jgi:hypothetical protein
LAAGLLQSEADEQSIRVSGTGVSWTNIRNKADELRQISVDTLEDGCDGNRLLTIAGNDKVLSRTLLKAAASSSRMTMKEYCKSMRRPSCWGGGVECVALSNVLNRQICMYEPLLLNSGNVVLRKIICFGPSAPSAGRKPLHVLIANDLFPARFEKGERRRGGKNHFLAVLPGKQLEQ